MNREDKIAIERYKKKLELIRSIGSVNAFDTPEDRKERIKKAQRDPAFMVEYYFPHFATAKSAEFQIKFAKKVLKNPQYKGFAEWGRAQAKSVWNNILIPFYLWINNEPIYFVLIGNSYDRAKQLLDDIRAEFEGNPRINHDFGSQNNPGKWEDGFFVTKGGFIGQALGTGQSVRGLRVGSKRPNHIVADDIEIKDTVKNPKRQQEIVRWIEGDLIPTMDGNIRRFIQANNRAYPVMIQTILQERHPNWDVDHVKAYNPVTYEPTWKEKYDNDYFKSIESEIGRLAALAEYNNEPHIEGTIFTDDLIQWRKLPPLNHFKIIIGRWDVAYSGTSTSDYNAVKVWGLFGNDFINIDNFVRQSKMREAVAWMCSFQLGLPPTVIVHWGFESQFWNDEVKRTIAEVEREYGTILNISQIPTSRANKYDRILSLHPYYQNGRIYYNEAKKSHADTQEGLRQLKGIEPGYRSNDDAPDADESAISDLSKYAYMSGSHTTPRTGRYNRPQRF